MEVRRMKDFREFILSSYGREHLTQYQGNMLHWITDESGEIIVDYIGRFEKLHEDYVKICERIGQPPPTLPHKKRSAHTHYSTYYDEETRQLVADRFRKEIDLFSYEFEELEYTLKPADVTKISTVKHAEIRYVGLKKRLRTRHPRLFAFLRRLRHP